jgi:predicted DNA-binding protein
MEIETMKEMTIRLPDEYRPKLEALAEQRGLRVAEFVRQKLIEVINLEERARHRAAMEEMVRQAITFQEIRDRDLERASLEALRKQAT